MILLEAYEAYFWFDTCSTEMAWLPIVIADNMQSSIRLNHLPQLSPPLSPHPSVEVLLLELDLLGSNPFVVVASANSAYPFFLD